MRERPRAVQASPRISLRSSGLRLKDKLPVLNSLDLPGSPQDTRVVVAMSGGVDSSVTAALLKAEGYEVVGVTLQLYDHGVAVHRTGACCAGQDIYDARAVAERIGIPHYVLDYENRFRETVIDRFAESYVAGETPVPCVECNQSIKFRDLLSTARELGAQVLATGHYVASRVLPGGARALFRAREAERDQSYFLFATTREQLDLLRFPLGDMTKAKTRELARRFGLPVADKHDSQDICFVPTGRYTEVIERLRPGAAGRRGVVGPREALRPSRVRLREVNWLGEGSIDGALCAGWHEVFVKVRSTRPPQPAWLSRGAGGIEVDLVEGEEGVSPGQACVFYEAAEGQARVLGGGFIRSSIPATELPARAGRSAPAAAL